MEATTLHLANGIARTVKGRAEEIGAALRARKLAADDVGSRAGGEDGASGDVLAVCQANGRRKVMAAETTLKATLDLDRARDAIRYIRRNDCDFLTPGTVMAYAGVDRETALEALRLEMGEEWCEGLDERTRCQAALGCDRDRMPRSELCWEHGGV